MRAGLLDSRVVQVHPTLRCNLRCAHCYSSSGPKERTELAPAQLLLRLARLRIEGYDVVSFSGGEPLVYPGLLEVMRSAAQLGFRVNLVTNGMLLTRQLLAELAPLVSVIGVSVDGIPERHDRLRRSRGAFARTAERLQLLSASAKETGRPFGLVHCITTDSIADVPWLIEYAVSLNAKLVQLHPLTLTGRAASGCDSLALSPTDLGRVFLMVELLRVSTEGLLDIQLDLAGSQQIRRDKFSVFDRDLDARTSLVLSDLVNPVVLDERGQLWPLAHGMAAEQRIADALGDEHWNQQLEQYKAGRAQPLRRLLEEAIATLEGQSPRFIDWYGQLVARSQQLAHPESRRLRVLEQVSPP